MTAITLHPGVFVQEIAAHATSIDGVSTNPNGGRPVDPGPAWTQPQPHDPGVSTLAMFAWLGESIAHRLGQVPTDRSAREAVQRWPEG